MASIAYTVTVTLIIDHSEDWKMNALTCAVVIGIA
jgi:hypothetical protein